MSGPVANAGQAGTFNGNNLGGLGGDAGAGVAGAAGQLSEGGGGESAAVPVQFWTKETQQIDIECEFGFFATYAQFRADRADLDANQLALLAQQDGVPAGSTDVSSSGGDDDVIDCVVTTSDKSNHERKYTFDSRGSPLIDTTSQTSGAGGQGGDDYSYEVPSLMGCQFYSLDWLDSAENLRYPYRAHPNCVIFSAWNPVWLNLETPGKPYHVDLIDCANAGNVTADIFGADPITPLATGVTPAGGPGPYGACLSLDVTVDAPVVARLVFGSVQEPIFFR